MLVTGIQVERITRFVSDLVRARFAVTVTVLFREKLVRKTSSVGTLPVCLVVTKVLTRSCEV